MLDNPNLHVLEVYERGTRPDYGSNRQKGIEPGDGTLANAKKGLRPPYSQLRLQSFAVSQRDIYVFLEGVVEVLPERSKMLGTRIPNTPIIRLASASRENLKSLTEKIGLSFEEQEVIEYKYGGARPQTTIPIVNH